MTRSEAYRLLSQELGLTPDECHMAKMNKETALRVPPAAGAIIKRLQSPPTCQCGHTREQHHPKTKGCMHVASIPSRARKQYGRGRNLHIKCDCERFRLG